MFRSSRGQRSGGQIVGVFSTSDIPVFYPDIITTFSYTGANQTLSVPTAGYNFAEYFLIGAAGGRGNDGTTNRAGGAGGGTTGILPVSGGATLTIIVGQGGRSSAVAKTGTYGNGGGTGDCPGFLSGEGGGRTAIQITAGTDAAVAAGGSGACGTKTGVAGGGTNGANASGTGAGQGGTQSAGGAGATGGQQGNGTSGAIRQGGAGAGYAGGGGAGYYGGGGGCNTDGTGGAGGSGSGLAGGSSATSTSGSGSTPALIGDSRYPGGTVGYGNTNSNQAGHGYAWVRLFN